MTATDLETWKGHDTTRPPTFIGYDQAERMLAALLDRAADGFAPEAVAGIVRGGLVPATMAACLLSLPLAMLRADRAGGAAWVGTPPDARRLLLVDDCCATGATLRAARDALTEQGFACRTLTITHDPETTGFVPDLSHPMTTLFRFPWERGDATPAARAARARGARPDRADERPFFGLDLDGVFLPDVPHATYAADIAAAIAERHALSPFPTLPAFAPERAVVITGRPDTDRAGTAAWLERWGHGALPLECRPAGLPHEAGTVAAYKAATATRWGCTHYIESDPEQALRIAAAAPHLIVTWWAAAEARGYVVGAAASLPSR